MGRAGVCPEDGDSAVPETRAAAAAGPLAKALCHEESFALQWGAPVGLSRNSRGHRFQGGTG